MGEESRFLHDHALLYLRNTDRKVYIVVVPTTIMEINKQEVKQMTRFKYPRLSLAFDVATIAAFLIMLYALGIVCFLHIDLMSNGYAIGTFVFICLAIVLVILVVADDLRYYIADIRNPGAGWRWMRADVGPEWGQ